jgi:putative DNA primase/helicase
MSTAGVVNQAHRPSIKVAEVLSKLVQVRTARDGWVARCPAHDDRNPSLSVGERDGKVLLHCFAGCTTQAVCDAAGVEMRDLFTDTTSEPHIVAQYDYLDEHGNLLFQTIRLDPKDFKQRQPDRGGWVWNLQGVRRVLYRLPEVLAASDVLICEGEKDCETARRWQFVATCNPLGAGKWRDQYSDFLRGKRVVVIADADTPGRKHAQQVAASLQGKAESLKVLELPDAKDLHEWATRRNGTRDDLLRLVADAPAWMPEPLALVHAPRLVPVGPIDPEVLPAGIEIHETDLGNALRFVQRYGGEVKHCAALGWLVWDGRRWKQQGEESSKIVSEWMKDTINAIFQEVDCALRAGDRVKAERLHAWALQSQSNSRIRAALALAESDRAISVTAKELDTHPMLLNLENGTLDLQKFELRPHVKADYITKVCAVEYDPQATHLEFSKFIERILPDEPVRNFVQRWLGYCLTGNVDEQKFFIGHGVGANGKSQLVELFRKLLGDDYAMRSKFDTFRLGGHGETRNDLAALKGMRLVTVSESGEDVPLDEALIKDVTGNEAITARFLYHEFFQYVPEFKITLSTNHKPTVYGQDYAIWRRLCLVPFEVTIPEGEREGEIHKRLLRDEAAGILNWALTGLREQQEITLCPPTKVQAATQDYRAEQDIVGQFLEERCEVGAGFEEQSQDLHAAYAQWAEGAGYKPFAVRRFNARLVAKGFKDEHNRKGKVWLGLRLKW